MSAFLRGNGQAWNTLRASRDNSDPNWSWWTPSNFGNQATGLFGQRCGDGSDRWPAYAMDAGTPAQRTLIGITKDSTGAALPGCTVWVFTTSDNQAQSAVVSDAAGRYCAPTPRTDNHFAVAYLAGSPDVAGTTVNNLVPT